MSESFLRDPIVMSNLDRSSSSVSESARQAAAEATAEAAAEAATEAMGGADIAPLSAPPVAKVDVAAALAAARAAAEETARETAEYAAAEIATAKAARIASMWARTTLANTVATARASTTALPGEVPGEDMAALRTENARLRQQLDAALINVQTLRDELAIARAADLSSAGRTPAAEDRTAATPTSVAAPAPSAEVATDSVLGGAARATVGVLGGAAGATVGMLGSVAGAAVSLVSASPPTTESEGASAPEPVPAVDVAHKEFRGRLPTIAFIGGTGRMGVHLCAAWANSGYEVIMCSRTKAKAQKIVGELLAGRGYMEEASAGGTIQVPPCDATGWKLKAGSNEDASEAELIVLGTVFEAAWPVLVALAPTIRGKRKFILDMTNPFLWRGDGYGNGLPRGTSAQSGIEYHKQRLDDPTIRWAGAYKTVLWSLVLPDGPKNPSRTDIEVFGDPQAVEVVSALIRAHGWQPVLRGGIDIARHHEGGVPGVGKLMGNMYREIFRGEKLSVGW